MQKMYVIKSLCEFCEKSTYKVVMVRDADSGEVLLVCKECAEEFGEWKDEE